MGEDQPPLETMSGKNKIFFGDGFPKGRVKKNGELSIFFGISDLHRRSKNFLINMIAIFQK